MANCRAMDRNRRDTKTGSDGGAGGTRTRDQRISESLILLVPTEYRHILRGRVFRTDMHPLMLGDTMLMLTANGFVGRGPSPSGKADLQTPKSPEGAMFASVGLPTNQGGPLAEVRRECDRGDPR